MEQPSKKITIVEVGPRDGLQNEKEIIPTETKVAFINKLSESGLKVIEATSFVHPKWVPQLADATEVIRGIQQHDGVRYPVLVPNKKGLERALAAGVKEIAVFTAASDTFNRKNINMTTEESLINIAEVVLKARPQGIRIRGYISTCFGCPYEGDISIEEVTEVTKKLAALRIDEISIGDTIGVATPEQAHEVMGALVQLVPPEKLAVHFHDTEGRALDNIKASLEHGITIIDSSTGGLGGCPYAPGAKGNVSTESVVRMLHKQGIDTGIDLNKLAEASSLISTIVTRA